MRTKWTHDLVRQEALKCIDRGEFRKLNGSAYNYALRNEILDDILPQKHQETFIKKAIGHHGDRYDYSLVNYKHSLIKVKILCKKHGVFEQTPNNHVQGQGCRECSSASRKFSTKKVVQQFKNMHGDVYDYSLVEYKSDGGKVKIICVEHGVFEQRANDHKNGKGCYKCYFNSITTESFIDECKKTHGKKYDYSKVNYTNAKKKVVIICKEHGEFKQRSSHHKNGAGCPKCYSVSDNDVLYIWEALGERWNDLPIFKIGITSFKNGDVRISQVAQRHNFNYKIHFYEYMNNASVIENKILSKLKVTPKLCGDGYTEFRALTDKQLNKVIKKAKKFQRRQNERS